jgi:hypothetical protein
VNCVIVIEISRILKLQVMFFLGGCIFLAFLGGGAAFAQEYSCAPSVKYACTIESCERGTSGFQQVESFNYSSRTGTLRACLWTSCFSGKAIAIRETSGTITAFGELTPEGPAAVVPITLSLTLDKQGKFTAVWSYGTDGLIFDFGACAIKP